MNFVRPIVQHANVDSFRSQAEGFLKQLFEKWGMSSPASDDLIKLKKISMPETSLISDI